MGWARRAWIAVALLAFAAGNATAAEPKRVLLLHSFGGNFQAEDTFAGYLRTDLAEKSPYPLDRYEVSLEIARFTDGERDEAFVDYLRALFADPSSRSDHYDGKSRSALHSAPQARPLSVDTRYFCCP